MQTDLLDAVQLGCRGDELARIRERHADRVADAAREWCVDEWHRDLLERLPFRPGDHVVAVGDSVTADSLSWFEQLTWALTNRHAGQLSATNLAVAGHCSHDTIEMLDIIADTCPDHVLIMLGTNDVRRHGPGQGVAMCSPAETARNLQAIQHTLIDQIQARVTFITPTPLDPVRMGAAQLPHASWCQADLQRVARTVTAIDPTAIDTYQVNLREGRCVLDLYDGLHPTIEAHSELLTVIVEQLAT